jgi:hypothetical protein
MSRRQVIFLDPSRRPQGKVLASRPEFAQRLDPSDSVHIHPWHPELDSFFQRLSYRRSPYRPPPSKNPNKNRTKSAPPAAFLRRPTHPN